VKLGLSGIFGKVVMSKWVFDIEATGAQRNKAHPYDKRNVACNVGFRNLETQETLIFKLEYDDEPYGKKLQEIQSILSESSVLTAFNFKYDLAWLRRYGLVVPVTTRLFDPQLAFWILTNQENQYPSLDQVAEHFGVEKKLDVVKLEYWDKGLDTNQVPYDILSEYLEQDLVVTAQVYDAVLQAVSESSYKMQKLINVSMQDLRVLQDIEQNGLLVNLEKSIKKGDDIVVQMAQIDEWLREVFQAPWLNPNSGDHLSVLLYGGTLKFIEKETYTFHYKDGRTAEKTRNAEVYKTFTGMFKPLEGSQLAKDGFYSTGEPILTKLLESARGTPKEVLTTLLQRAKLEKRRGTYYHGYPKRMVEMGWDDNIMHSNFNQCVAVSGRLSSTKPNVQNIEAEVKEVFISRFKRRKK
jgi:DNA polymerase I-like protein with 3'-5' exonuclease and polymerase domains